jgi:hypothetical protein
MVEEAQQICSWGTLASEASPTTRGKLLLRKLLSLQKLIDYSASNFYL